MATDLTLFLIFVTLWTLKACVPLPGLMAFEREILGIIERKKLINYCLR